GRVADRDRVFRALLKSGNAQDAVELAVHVGRVVPQNARQHGISTVEIQTPIGHRGAEREYGSERYCVLVFILIEANPGAARQSKACGAGDWCTCRTARSESPGEVHNLLPDIAPAPVNRSARWLRVPRHRSADEEWIRECAGTHVWRDEAEESHDVHGR